MSIFATARTVSRLKSRVADLDDTCADLQRASRKLDLEFTELYDKVSHQMGRMAKRYATRSAADQPEPEADTPEMFTNHVDPISAKILARRNRMGNSE